MKIVGAVNLDVVVAFMIIWWIYIIYAWICKLIINYIDQFLKNTMKPNKKWSSFHVISVLNEEQSFWWFNKAYLKNEILFNSILITLQKSKNPLKYESSQKQSQSLEKNKSLSDQFIKEIFILGWKTKILPRRLRKLSFFFSNNRLFREEQ